MAPREPVAAILPAGVPGVVAESEAAVADGAAGASMKKMIRRLEGYGLSLLAVYALLHAASYSSYSSSTETQKTFANPKDAVKAVIASCKENDQESLLTIFGPDGKDIVDSGDPSDDTDRRAAFVQLTGQKYKLIPNPMKPDTMVLSIGKEDYPFPVPLVRKGGRWFFDSSAGRQEILARRIGSNEMSAIEVCRGYVEAQLEYAQNHRPNGIPAYAQKILSSSQQTGWIVLGSLRRTRPNARFPKVSLKRPPACPWKKREPYRVIFPHFNGAGSGGARGGGRLCGQWIDDRRFCSRGVAGGIRRLRHPDLYRQS